VVQERVLSKTRSEKLKVFVIWLPMVEGDSRDAAAEAIKLLGDVRVSHFWDSRKEMARAFGKVIGQPNGKQPRLAWDFYAVFGPSAKWKDDVPEPADWMHQLDGLDANRRLDGDKLRESILQILNAPVHKCHEPCCVTVEGVRSGKRC
jgi:hypothetical protein